MLCGRAQQSLLPPKPPLPSAASRLHHGQHPPSPREASGATTGAPKHRYSFTVPLQPRATGCRDLQCPHGTSAPFLSPSHAHNATRAEFKPSVCFEDEINAGTLVGKTTVPSLTRGGRTQHNLSFVMPLLSSPAGVFFCISSSEKLPPNQ